MAIFNENDSVTEPVLNVALSDEALDDFGIGLRYINDVSAYRPSERSFELLVIADGSVSYAKSDSKFSVPHHSVIFSFPGEGWQLAADEDSGVVCYSVLVSPCLLTEFCNLVSHKAMDLLFSGEGHKIFRMHYSDYEYFVHTAELAISSDGAQSAVLTKRIAYNLISQLILSLEQTSDYP